MYIRQRSGGWRVEVERNGQRISATFPSKRAAQAWGHEQEGKAKLLRKGWHTLAEAVQEYEARYSVHKRSPEWESRALARLLAQIGADTPVAEIDSARIAKWRDERLKTVSGSTVNREANLLRAMLRVAWLEWGWLEGNPFAGVSLPKESAPRSALWTWPLIRRVLRAPADGKTADVVRAFRLSLHTGLRLQEALTASYDARRGVLVLPMTKAGERQEVPVPRRARKLLPMTPVSVGANEASTLFSRLLKRLLIEGLTFHDARASALTWLARRVDVLTLARISRHRDLRILNDHYYRETPEQIAARL